MKSYMRQEGIISPDVLSKAVVKVIGAGSVGSFIVLALAKMGISDIEVWDNDIVQEHNLPNQFYRLQDLNKPKVMALQEIIKMYEGVDIKVHNERYNGQELEGIVISAVDSLDARKFIWQQVLSAYTESAKISHYIDTRMGGNLMRIYPVILPKIDMYDKVISNPKAKDTLLEIKCTERTILYNVLVISGLVGNLVVKILKGEDTPVSIIFDLKTLMFYQE